MDKGNLIAIVLLGFAIVMGALGDIDRGDKMKALEARVEALEKAND